MPKNTINGDVQRLIDRGYTPEDLYAMGAFAREEIEQALRDQDETNRQRARELSAHNQARYAWNLSRHNRT